jgi:hypothetical protein
MPCTHKLAPRMQWHHAVGAQQCHRRRSHNWQQHHIAQKYTALTATDPTGILCSVIAFADSLSAVCANSMRRPSNKWLWALGHSGPAGRAPPTPPTTAWMTKRDAIHAPPRCYPSARLPRRTPVATEYTCVAQPNGRHCCLPTGRRSNLTTWHVRHTTRDTPTCHMPHGRPRHRLQFTCFVPIQWLYLTANA